MVKDYYRIALYTIIAFLTSLISKEFFDCSLMANISMFFISVLSIEFIQKQNYRRFCWLEKILFVVSFVFILLIGYSIVFINNDTIKESVKLNRMR